MAKKKLSKGRSILYCDGSHRDNKSAWGYMYIPTTASEDCNLGFGCCYSQSSIQAEIISCIKGIANSNLQNCDVDELVVKTDLISLVWFFQNEWYRKLTVFNIKELGMEFINQNVLELHELYQLVKSLPYKVTFAKANKCDTKMIKVHNLAKQALNDYDLTHSSFWFMDSVDCDFIQLKKDKHRRQFIEDPVFPPYKKGRTKKTEKKEVEQSHNNGTDNSADRTHSIYRMSDLAQKYGILHSQIRFYMKEGLLSPSSRTQGGFYLFYDQDDEILKQILELKKQRYKITEIKDILKERQ